MLKSFAEEGITLLDEVVSNVFVPVLSDNDDAEDFSETFEEELMSNEYKSMSDWTEYGSELEFE